MGHGNETPNSIRRWGASAVWRLSRADARKHTVVAEGFDMANGLVFDPAGNLYVSNDSGRGPVRLPAGDRSAWSVWGTEWGTNGMAVRDGWLYAAETFDAASRIVRMRRRIPRRSRSWPRCPSEP